ncbi:MAG: VRR-NUC domain-containing protein [Gammaproteobacteria bacterium]|nr:VRR-NUC domain-containing protein [Gammaproteobacteria bacterium]MBU1732253.1 VRR-NUC domain-containing protein [Gammaproteobacteria bacterium]MBU1893823.1 VRR-NUC domain-containing protein [Gammaproteobacteria bacterium]
MRERDIETHLVRRVREAGGISYKFTSPQRRSVPDRLVLMPKGSMYFVECKAPGCKTTRAQDREHARMRDLGFLVAVIDSLEAVEELF